MTQRGICATCGKEDSGSNAFCDCGKPPQFVCEICMDQTTLCQDCALEYCGECFHTTEHDLCLPVVDPKPKPRKLLVGDLVLQRAIPSKMGTVIATSFDRGSADVRWESGKVDARLSYHLKRISPLEALALQAENADASAIIKRKPM